MTTYYAIGDIHGEHEKLKRLVDAIWDDAQAHNQPFAFVFLGDYVDRGPDSRGVIELILALQRSGAVVHALKGNHEEMMLNAYDSTSVISNWAMNGGEQALESYVAVNGERSDWRESIDKAHIAWMRALPTLVFDPERRLAFVHAGIEPRSFPACGGEVHMWTRSREFTDTTRWPERDELRGLLVVHGHTPTDDNEPEVLDRRINVDTGACFGGPLTCVVLAPSAQPRFLHAV